MRRRGAAALALLPALAMLPALAAAEVAAEESFAARFFRSGEASRPVQVGLEGSPGSFPATLFSCAGCHGESGEGRREGGTSAADIRPSRLAAGRRYDEALFCRAVVDGRDPEGLELARAMPRYQLERRECAELWFYLQRLEEAPPPGVGPDEIVIAVTMKEENAARMAWREVLRQELEAVNRQGGIFGRRWRLAGGNEKAALRILVDGELPEKGEATDELLISVPPPRRVSPEWELWQIETPRERQLALLASAAPLWRVVASPASGEVAALFADAAGDAEAQIDRGRSCGPNNEPRQVLALSPGPAELAELERLDACPGERRFVLFEPALPLEAFAGLRQPWVLVVPFDPGPQHDLHAGARRLARTLVKAFDRAGRKLRLSRLIEALNGAFAEEGGGGRALYGGILLLPPDDSLPSQWLGNR